MINNMYCKFCGNKIENNYRFCSNCGELLNETTSDVNTSFLNAAIGIVAGSKIGDAIAKANADSSVKAQKEADILRQELERKLKVSNFNPN